MGVAGSEAAVRTEETPVAQVEVVTARRQPHVVRAAVVVGRPAATVVVEVAPDRPERGGAVVTELQTIRA